MKITYFGHACFLIDDILIDPFITGNPLAPVKPEEIKCRVICVTHGHADHLGDAVKISKENNAPIIAIFELAEYLNKKGVKTVGLNLGGSVEIEGVKITQVKAEHSSTILEKNFIPVGVACGYLIEKDKKVYHAGDTSLFYDMKLIGETGIDVALLPIGGTYTMDIRQAVKACELIKPKVAIPMHYNTFPVIKTDPKEFKEKAPCKVIILKPGESWEVE